MVTSTLQFPTERLLGNSLIAGEWQPGEGGAKDIRSPYNGSILGQVSSLSASQVDRLTRSARSAFEQWRRVPLKERCSLLLNFRTLLLRDLDMIANSAARECGKTLAEAKAEVLKGIEVLEFAASLQDSDLGGALDVSRGVKCEYVREPLGVTVGITPFNFPAMVPMWMIPISLAVGNAFILKPSDKVPFTPCVLGDLLREAGFPSGVFSIAQGGQDVVEALIDHPLVSAVGFVGSTPIARRVYARCAGNGKRALCLGGAKNHLILAPDADPSVAIDGIVASFTGCAGQRCMAGSVLVAVADCDEIVDRVVAAAGRIVLGRDMGALIDSAARERLTHAIEKAARDGATVRLDGRTHKAPKGYEGGSWLAPTILDGASREMECSQCELFGPVLTIVRVATLEEAMALEKGSPYGNATSVFTSSGAVARYVVDNATSGMVGINIGVPVPREPFSFGGAKESRFGASDITGSGGVEFWSQRKKVTTKWSTQSDKTWMS